jgi:predicted ATPase
MAEDQITLFPQPDPPPPDVYPSAFVDAVKNAPSLIGIHINGLKAFDDTEVALPRLAVLTGPNNSGKSTILQGLALGYECLRRCVDATRWKLVESGRAVTEFEFLPVNEPRDLWYRRVWKPSKDKERTVEITLTFQDTRALTFRIRFLFGLLNIRLAEAYGDFDKETLQALLGSAPVLLPATPGPSAHEDYLTLAAVHKMLSVREPSRVVRNILSRLQRGEDKPALQFVNDALMQYFGVQLSTINFDERRDLEIRAPVEQEDYSLDIVSSGSGLNQILQLASIIAWRKPALVLLDEPDAHLHSSVQAQLFDFIHSLVERHGIQVILSTHSRDLISQAPLESIIPVDATRNKLGPLQSLEHLLLEYQRFGPLSNVDLALLYQTKSCVFLEGPTDARLLPRIAERCGISLFLGSRQAVPFEFQGVDKLKFLPDLVRLFERLVGGALHWAVIRDSDASLPEVKAEYMKIGTGLGAAYFHQWERHSLENYLIEPHLLVAAIRAKYPQSTFDEEETRKLLTEAASAVEDDASGTFVTRAQLAYRDFKLAENPYDVGAAAAAKYLRQVSTLEQKLQVYPGKKIFGEFVQHLQQAHKLTLRIDDVVAILDSQNTSPEVVSVLKNIDTALRS